MGELWQAALDLVLGACCPLCGEAGAVVCRDCAAAVTPRPVVVELAGLDVIAAGTHADRRRDAVLAWKVGGHLALDPVMAHHLATAVLVATGGLDRFALVPVPSTRRSRRERGRDLVGDLARRTARRLAGVGVDVQVLPLVRLTRQPRDQHALDRVQRRRNLAGSMRSQEPPRDLPLVVVDDVVTTGATLLEVARAVSHWPHGQVLAGAALAVASHPDKGLRSR